MGRKPLTWAPYYGLKHKRAKSPSLFSISRPKLQTQEEGLTLLATSFLYGGYLSFCTSNIHAISSSHASTSLLLPLSLLLSAESKHTHTQFTHNSLSFSAETKQTHTSQLDFSLNHSKIISSSSSKISKIWLEV